MVNDVAARVRSSSGWLSKPNTEMRSASAGEADVNPPDWNAVADDGTASQVANDAVTAVWRSVAVTPGTPAFLVNQRTGIRFHLSASVCPRTVALRWR